MGKREENRLRVNLTMLLIPILFLLLLNHKVALAKDSSQDPLNGTLTIKTFYEIKNFNHILPFLFSYAFQEVDRGMYFTGIGGTLVYNTFKFRGYVDYFKGISRDNTNELRTTEIGFEYKSYNKETIGAWRISYRDMDFGRLGDYRGIGLGITMGSKDVTTNNWKMFDVAMVGVLYREVRVKWDKPSSNLPSNEEYRSYISFNWFPNFKGEGRRFGAFEIELGNSFTKGNFTLNFGFTWSVYYGGGARELGLAGLDKPGAGTYKLGIEYRF